MIINNVNLDAIAQQTEAIKQDAAKALRINRLEAEWQVDPSKPQMFATINYEGGQMRLECDSPTFMGGKGSTPGPLHYCIFGLLTCFTGTFVTMASAQGIQLRSLKAAGQCDLDFSKVFGVADNPIVRGVTFTLEVDSDASAEALEQVRQEALARCPAVYSMSNPITVSAQVRPTQPQ